jgi:hypothetical protein
MMSLKFEFSFDPHIYIPVQMCEVNDLSARVKGQAYWITYQDNRRSAYHILSDNGVEAPIEFTNHRWYFLMWKPDQGYLTNPSCLIEKHQLGTGWYSEQERPPILPLSPQEPPPAYNSPATESSNSNPPYEESDEDIAI